MLAQSKELDHVGEQSLLPGPSGRRNASLRTCEDTTLLGIPKAEFQKVLTQQRTLKALLSQEGRQQLRANLIRTTKLARIWALFMFVPHPPAAATTLIVSLGLVSRPAYLVILQAAVGLLLGQAIVINRLTGVRYPVWINVPTPKIGALADRGALQRFVRHSVD